MTSDRRPLAYILSADPDPELLTRALSGFLEAVSTVLPIVRQLAVWPGRMMGPGGEEGQDAVEDLQKRTAFHGDLARWFTAAWRLDRHALADLSAQVHVTPELLEWAGRQLARPFFHRLGELLAEQPLQDEWPVARTRCPCCGGAPRFGRYERHEGRRHLWCDLCNIQWSFPRITCPFCLNADQEKLGFLAIEGVSNYRIDVCEVCRGYLRSLDERDLPDDARVDFLKEDVGTYHLCLAAEKQGWRQGEIDRDAMLDSGQGEDDPLAAVGGAGDIAPQQV